VSDDVISSSLGAPVALLLLTVREPSRREARGDGDVDDDRLFSRPFLTVLAARRSQVAWQVIGFGVFSIMTYGALAWAAAYFGRHFGWSAARFGYAFGWLFAACGAAAANFVVAVRVDGAVTLVKKGRLLDVDADGGGSGAGLFVGDVSF